MNRAISMGECMDLDEVVDDYIRNKWLQFDEEEHVINLPF
jgi:hypothetical protein